MLTNRLGLPDAMVRAVANDPYSAGDSDITVTQLISPPYQRALRAKHDTLEDAADRMWALLGQATHSVLERAYPVHRRSNTGLHTFYKKTGFLREERLYANALGWKVGGQIDLFEHGILKDYKVTSVWSVIEPKWEWEMQLNLLAALMRRNLFTIDGLQIVAILRDWQQAKARVSRAEDYPQLGVQVIEIPMWSWDKADEFLAERVRLHQTQQPAPCTDEERWKTETVWAVMKDGRKSAVKLHATEAAASEHCTAGGAGYSVVVRPGEYRRCAEYCNVSHVCPQWKSEVPF